MAAGAHVLQHVQANAPQDAIVRASAFGFEVPAPGPEGQFKLALKFGENGSTRSIHKHALGQLAERAGVPSAYLGDLASSESPWANQLAARILNDHTHLGMPQDRLLVRSVNGQVRGVLSDKYRRLDSLPLIEAFAGECQRFGAVCVGGTASDTRLALKALLPLVFEPVKGEALAIGIEWFNSDFGAGKYGIRSYLLRLVCLNGATAEDAFSQVHLGGRLAEEISYSDKTLQLDTQTTMSATKDHVRMLLEPAKVNSFLDGIRRADERKVDWRGVRGRLAKSLNKGELEKVKEAFEGQDVVNLPPGQSEWRASNAVSWIANTVEDADRKLELERVAGSFFGTEKRAN